MSAYDCHGYHSGPFMHDLHVNQHGQWFWVSGRVQSCLHSLALCLVIFNYQLMTGAQR